jgi:hypothetical protein
MGHREQIASLLRQWLIHTRQESDAIQAGDWNALRQIQSGRAELRPALTEVTERWRAENPSEFDLTAFSQDLARLLAMESHNVQLLVARRRKTQERKALLEQALYNLRRVRSSYGQPAQAVVHTYS